MSNFVKNWIRPYAIHIFPWFIVISVILASYSIYEKQKGGLITEQGKIDKLQNDLDVSQKMINGLKDKLEQKQIQNIDTPITKQDLRTFLETINPAILIYIDIRKKEIPILIGTTTQIKLSTLSERPNFDKYLSFKKTGKIVIGSSEPNDYIKALSSDGFMEGYLLYPKDALINTP